MYLLLLAIIYVAFISLGLPDALLGSAWPVMQSQMGVPLSYAGIVAMIIPGGTILSSLLSDRLTKKFGTGLVTAISVLITAVSLFGFSISGSFWMLCVWAVPYGFGAGAVDAALNNYVALHYASRHMNWLHCFWGLGAAISPFIMSGALTRGMGWNSGYGTVSVIQIALTAVLLFSLPLWKRQKASVPCEQSRLPAQKLSHILRIKGVKFALLAFLGYCAIEATTFLWASSYLVQYRGIGPEMAARYASFFFIGITAGRFISGFISDKIGDRNMVRIGLGIILAGITAVWLPLTPDWLCLNGLIVIGLGCAPVYPAIIHSTPANFGKESSQAVIGVQMASAYVGATFMPPLFGFLANNIGIGLFPAFLLVFMAWTVVMTEKLNKVAQD